MVGCAAPAARRPRRWTLTTALLLCLIVQVAALRHASLVSVSALAPDTTSAAGGAWPRAPGGRAATTARHAHDFQDPRLAAPWRTPPDYVVAHYVVDIWRQIDARGLAWVAPHKLCVDVRSKDAVLPVFQAPMPHKVMVLFNRHQPEYGGVRMWMDTISLCENGRMEARVCATNTPASDDGTTGGAQ